jgi:hypothetical protein
MFPKHLNDVEDTLWKSRYWQHHFVECLNDILERYYFDDNYMDRKFTELPIQQTILKRSRVSPHNLQISPIIDEMDTISKIATKYGSRIHQLKLSNGIFASVPHQEMNELIRSLDTLTTLQLHDLKDESVSSVIEMLLGGDSITSLKLLHGFLSEQSINKIFYSLLTNYYGQPLSLGETSSVSLTKYQNVVYDDDEEIDMYGDLDLNDNGKRVVEIESDRPVKKPRMNQDIVERMSSLVIRSHTFHYSTCEVISELLLHMNQLRTIELGFNHLNAKMGQTLVKGLLSTQIERLVITENDIGDETLRAIGDAIRASETNAMQRLRYLDLSNNDLSDASYFFECLLEMKSVIRLQTLRLSNNNLNKEIIGLCKFLRSDQPCSLTTLVLSQCEISSSQLYAALSVNHHITQLDIGDNWSPNGSEAIGHMLLRNTTLRHLDVSYNGLLYIDPVLENALCHNTTLVSLNLSGNRLEDHGGVAIAGIIKKRIIAGVTVTDENGLVTICPSLAISVNRMYDGTCLALMEAISSIAECNHTNASYVMKYLDIGQNFFSESSISAIKDIVSTNISNNVDTMTVALKRLQITNVTGEQRAYELCDGATVT